MENKHVFIGREKELETLQQAYKEAQTGKGKLVLVSGNTGLGKSALIKTFFSQIEKDENTISGFSESTDMEDQNPYAPLKNLFIELNAKSYDKKVTIDKVKDIMSEAGPAWVGMLPVIGNSLSAGITTFQSIRKAFSKDKNSKPIIDNKDDVFRIFEAELRRIAKKKTLVVCIDDLQWADTSSLNVMYELGRKIRNNPFKILLIGTYRPNEIKIGRKKDTEKGLVSVRHPFADKLNELRNYSKSGIHDAINPNWLVEISLKPFSKNEFTDYINTLFVNNDFKERFYDVIFDLTDGDPLFVTEIIEQLHLNKSIEEINGVFKSKELDITDLPKSVSASIAEKVERLNDVLKKILSYASVNGEKFMVEIIEKIMNIDGLELLDFLEELENKHNLLKEDAPIYVKEELFNQYQFSRSLVHKYIYDTLSNAQKRELHKRIAKNLLAIYGEVQMESNKSIKDKYLLHKQIGVGLINPDDYSINSRVNNQVDEANTEIAEYITAAEETLQKAKESYLKQFATHESLDFADKTLAFLSKIDKNTEETQVLRFKALKWRNKSLSWQGNYQKAYDTAFEMASIADHLKNDELLAEANLALGSSKSSLGYKKEAIVYFEKSIDYYRTTENYISLFDAYQGAGNANNAMAAYDDAIILFQKALALSDKIEDRNLKGSTLLSLGKSYSAKLVDSAIVFENYNKALEIFKATNSQYWIGKAYNDIGNEYRSEGKNDLAKEFLDLALDIAHDQNDMVNISNRLNNIALIYESKEEFEKAIDYYKKTLAIDKQLDDIPMIAKSMNNIGSVYASKGDFETAMDYLDKSHEIIKSINNPKELSTSYFTLSTAYKLMDKKDKTEEYLIKAIAIDRDISDEASLSLHDYFLGFFYYENNRYEEASKYLEESLELLTKIGHKYFIAVINNTLGLIAKDEGNHEKAINFFTEALAYYVEVEDKTNILDVKENLANTYYDAKQYEKAVELLQESIILAEQAEENTFLSRLYPKIGNALFWLEKHAEAKPFYTKEIAISSSLFGERSSEIANGYEHQANNYYWNNQYEEAIECYLQVLDIRTELFGETSAEVDFVSFSLAEAYYYADKDETAKKLFEKSLVYRKETYGEDSEEYQKAKEYLEKINGTTPSVAGSAAPDDKQSVKSDTDQLQESIIKEFESNFATGYQHFEKAEYPEAIQNYEQALESLKLLPDNDESKKSRADIYFQLGHVNKYTKDYDAAITYFIESYNTYLKLSEVNKNDLGTICIFLGDIYYIKNDYKNAIENHKEALSLLETKDASNNNMLAWANFNLGSDYYWNKQYDEAIIYYRKSLNIKKEIYGEEHGEIVLCLVKIGKSYFEKGDNLSAIQNLKNAYKINKNLYGASSREADEVQIMLGQAYFYSERKEEAKECLHTSLEFRKEFFGENSEEYKFVHKWIGDNFK